MTDVCCYMKKKRGCDAAQRAAECYYTPQKRITFIQLHILECVTQFVMLMRDHKSVNSSILKN